MSQSRSFCASIQRAQICSSHLCTAALNLADLSSIISIKCTGNSSQPSSRHQSATWTQVRVIAFDGLSAASCRPTNRRMISRPSLKGRPDYYYQDSRLDCAPSDWRWCSGVALLCWHDARSTKRAPRKLLLHCRSLASDHLGRRSAIA